MPTPSASYPTEADPIIWSDTALLYQGFRDLVVEANLPPSLRGEPWQQFQRKKYNETQFQTRDIDVVWERFGENDPFLAYIQTPIGGSVLAELNDAEKEVLEEGNLYIRLSSASGAACFCCSLVKLTLQDSVIRPVSSSAQTDCKNVALGVSNPLNYYGDTDDLFNSEVLARAARGDIHPTAFAEIVGGSSEIGSGHVGFLNYSNQPCQRYTVTYDIVQTGEAKTCVVRRIVRTGTSAQFCWPIKASYYSSDILGMLRLAAATRHITEDWFAPGSNHYKVRTKNAATESMVFWNTRKKNPNLGITFGLEPQVPGSFHIPFSSDSITAPIDGPFGLSCRDLSCITPEDVKFYGCAQASGTNTIPASFPMVVQSPFTPGLACSSPFAKVYARTFRQLGAALSLIRDFTSPVGGFEEVAFPVGGISGVLGLSFGTCACCSNPRAVKKAISGNPQLEYRRENEQGDWIIGGAISPDETSLSVSVPDVSSCVSIDTMNGQYSLSESGYYGFEEDDCYVAYPVLQIYQQDDIYPQGAFYVYGVVFGVSLLHIANSNCQGCACGNGFCDASATVSCASQGGADLTDGLSISYVSNTGTIGCVSASATGSITRTLHQIQYGTGGFHYKNIRTWEVEAGGGWDISNGGTITVIATNEDKWDDVQYDYRTYSGSYSGCGISVPEPGQLKTESETNESGGETITYTGDTKYGEYYPPGSSTPVPYTRLRYYYDDAPEGGNMMTVYDDDPAPGAPWTLGYEAFIESTGSIVLTKEHGFIPGSTGTAVCSSTSSSSVTTSSASISGAGESGSPVSGTVVFKTTCATGEPTYQSTPISLDGGTTNVSIPQPPVGCTTCIECVIADNAPGEACAAIVYTQGDPCSPTEPQTFYYTIRVTGLANTSYSVLVTFSGEEPGEPVTVVTDENGVGNAGPFGPVGGSTSISGVSIVSP